MEDIIKLFTPTQWIVLGVGAVMLVLGVKDYVIDFVTSFFNNDDNDSIDDKEKANTLTSVVKKWEDLSNACKEANLIEAYNKLQEVFPMLVSIYEPKVSRKTGNEK